MNYKFRKATPDDLSKIWIILQQAIVRRKYDGSQQWQDGYPNENVVEQDIAKGIGYVLTLDNTKIISWTVLPASTRSSRGTSPRFIPIRCPSVAAGTAITMATPKPI